MKSIPILFWFYKDIEICENRLQLIKKYNPDSPIFGLFGGKHEEAPLFEKALAPYLEDFYTSEKEDSDWKWIHGDLVLLEWYQNTGKSLDWKSIAVIQWDMLLFDSLSKIFPDIKEDEIYFSGLKNLTEDVEKAWWHTSATEEIKANYKNFFSYVKEHYDYDKKPPLCCQFIFEILPRIFFEKYATIDNIELGMLEYKTPTYADIFNIPFYKKDLGTAWEDLGEDLKNAPMNASPRGELDENYIRSELAKDDGWRMFHPYQKMWKEK